MNKNFTLLFVILFSCPTIFGSWAEVTLQNLTLEEKIGQLFMVSTVVNPAMQEEIYAKKILEGPCRFDHEYIEYLIKEYHIGGLIYLCKGTPTQQIDVTNHFQTMSKLPLLIGLDAEWGLTMRLYETIRFPRNMTLGALPNSERIYELGKIIGEQCKAIGVHINFAPVVDINTNPENPIIHDRSFGESKEHVTEWSIAYMKGLQDAGILACAKHFPGHGDTSQDSHLSLPTVAKTKDELYECELYPFAKLIQAGIDCIMNAHLRVPAFDKTRNLPSSLSCKIVKNLLQEELGFTGLCITDGMDMKGVTKHHKAGTAELLSLLAGNHIILCPVDVPKAVVLIKEALEQGTLTHKELDARVFKILVAKEQLNLNIDRHTDKEKALQIIQSDKAYQLKKELFSQAITLVNYKKNESLVVDFSKTALVQFGGYLPSEFETTLQKDVPVPSYHLPTHPKKEQIDFILSKIGDKQTIIIAFFDMTKNATLNYGIDEKALKLIETLRTDNKKVIITLFGTPYSLTFFEKEIPILVAYEDDPDAQCATAKVLLGQKKAEGTLPVEIE